MDNTQRSIIVNFIDATLWSAPLRKNLGKKNCRFSEARIRKIVDLVLKPKETPESKIFPDGALGCRKIVVEKPLCLLGIESDMAYGSTGIKDLVVAGKSEAKGIPVIRTIHGKGINPDPLHSLLKRRIEGKKIVVEYESESQECDIERLSLLERVKNFFAREVLPYTPGACIDVSKIHIGYEISFTRHFYKLGLYECLSR